VLVPIALLVEGRPPHVDGTNVMAYVYLGTIGTGLAYVCWFHGLSRMPAGSTALVGLVNPVVGTALGVVVMHEAFGPAQLLGVVLVLGGVLAGQPTAVSWLRSRLSTGLSQPAPTVEACATASFPHTS
jgi:probable blue pigment (indigoidine) exporter